jgi:GT2 family glycosyltransferase
MTASREIILDSRIDEQSIEIVICVPSFRRPQHLRLTLESLAAQQTSHRFGVVIVENDAATRASVVEAVRFLEKSGIPGISLVEPQQGNCYAINAAFETALTSFPAATMLLMIDDDEVASPQWLQSMVDAARSTGADVVGGPVFPAFDDATKRDLGRHPAFCPAYASTGAVPMIYGSGNCLIARRVFTALANPSFDVRFNFLGGGDMDFFSRCRRAGMTFYWVAEAVIVETVPTSRTKIRWLAARGLRIGAINYRVRAITAQSLLSRATLLARTLALLPLSLWRAMRLAITERQLLIALHPIVVAVGGTLATVGIEPQPYKDKITSA